jgi:hypothetical protein
MNLRKDRVISDVDIRAEIKGCYTTINLCFREVEYAKRPLVRGQAMIFMPGGKFRKYVFNQELLHLTGNSREKKYRFIIMNKLISGHPGLGAQGFCT